MQSDKESNFDKISVLLLDVAGTTTSLEYIKDKLFAYIIEESPTFLKESSQDEAVKSALKGLQEGDKELDVDSAVEVIKKLTNENSDNKNLKTLQGLISKAGYEKGSLKAHIFKDVKTAFETWSKDKKIAIYSTGDIEAQKLLFSNTIDGDVSSHISNYFDQSAGLKTVPESYSKIIDELKVKSEEVLFISDNPDELMAAKKSGLVTALIKREGNAEVTEEIAKEFTTTVSSFNDLVFESSNKRKIDAIDGSETPPTKVAKTDEPKIEKDKPEAVVEEKKNETNSCQQEQNGAVEGECEPMEVDSTITEVKKPEEKETVPTNNETSMETETDQTKIVPEDVVSIEPAKTETENLTDKIELPTVDTNTIETETKTENSETVDETDKVANVDLITDKIPETISDKEKNDSETEVKMETDVKENLDTVASDEKPNGTDNISNPKEEIADSQDESQKKQEVSTEGSDKVSNDVDKTNDSKNVEVEVKSKPSKESKESAENGTSEATEISEETKDMETSSNEQNIETKGEETKEDSVKEKVDEKAETVVEEKTDIVKEKSEVREEKTKVVEEEKAEVMVEEKTEATTVEEKKDVEETKDVKETKDVEQKKQETNVVETPPDSIETKTDEKSEGKQEDTVEDKNSANVESTEKIETKETEVSNETNTKSQENGTATENQNGSVSVENVSNGVLNGQDSCDTSSNDQNGDESTDIKVKKIETNVGSPAVAVEV